MVTPVWQRALLTGVAVSLLGVVVGLAWRYYNDGRPVNALVAAMPEPSGGQAGPNGQQFIPVGLPQPSPAEVAAEKARQAAAEKLKQRETALKQTIIPYLQTHCADCHSQDTQEGGVVVTNLTTLDQFLQERKSWERVYRMINAGAMPPADYDPKPTAEQQQKVADLLHDELYNFDCKIVQNSGRPTVQRLNRTEYNNTIRDLFGIDLRPADKFPADDVGEGFDNIGDVLSVPPLLMEKYLAAAEEVAAAVIDTTDYSKPLTLVRSVEELHSKEARPSGNVLMMASRGTVTAEFDLPASGTYDIEVTALAQQFGPEKAKFALLANGEGIGEYATKKNRQAEQVRLQAELPAGPLKLAAVFINDHYQKNKGDRNLGIGQFVLKGPHENYEPEYSDIHRRFVTVTPKDTGNVNEAAYQVLRPLMEKAFRRGVTDVEVSRYSRLVSEAVDQMGETYEGGLSLALQAILVSPDFLFRLEKEPDAGTLERPLNDFEIASRLSYFLWSSMPDEELFDLAKFARLRDPDVLKQQARRMLQDPKADALVQNFASQCLNLRNLDEVTPDRDKFKFDDKLRNDMRRETELLFQAIMKEDRSIEDLLAADFTFLNKRLAEHYGIDGVKSDEFERVSLQGTGRSGVLTHASILTLTSDPGRTSPVKRGKWILENILGEAPPPPPPNVPELEETAKAAPDASLREQLAKHREDPGCASCHKVMDPLGLGFENFDAVGRWRDKDNGKPIDASGELPGGDSFDGSLELIKIIQKQRDKYFRTLTEKMLVYAIGRGTHYYDKCAVDKALEQMKQQNYRFSSLVESIVLSDPFLKKSAPQPQIAQPQSATQVALSIQE